MKSIQPSLRSTFLFLILFSCLYLSISAIPFSSNSNLHSLTSHLLLHLQNPSSHQSTTTGYSFDLCLSDIQCTSPRQCFDSQQVTQPCSSSSTACGCITNPANLCTTSSDCLSGDRCTQFTSSQSSTIIKVCVSCQADAIFTDSESFCLVDLDDSNCVGTFRSPIIPVCVGASVTPTVDSTETMNNNTAVDGDEIVPSPIIGDESMTTNFTDSSDNNNDSSISSPMPLVSVSPTPSVTVPSDGDDNVASSATELPTITDIPSSPTTNVTTTSDNNNSTNNSTTSGGYTADSCTTDSDCIGTRSCLIIVNDTTQVLPCPTTTSSSSANQQSCRCYPHLGDALKLLHCPSGSKQCETGDRCIRNIETDNQRCLSCQSAHIYSTTTSNYCYADADITNCVGSIPTTTTTNITVCPDVSVNSNNNDNNDDDGEEEPVCIAVSSLIKHLSINDMVYTNNHRKASVLCDVYGNCATPVHMVEYKGKRLMMMKNYCAVIKHGCVKRVRMVNSPKMKMGLRIPSNHEDLKFTAVAARYGTKAEERLFQSLTRFFGL